MNRFDTLFSNTVPCGFGAPPECAMLSRARYPDREEAARVMTADLLAMGFLPAGSVIEPEELFAEWVRYRWPGEEDGPGLDPRRHYWLPNREGPGAKPVWVWE